MGALIGFTFASGVLLIALAFGGHGRPHTRTTAGNFSRLAAQSGIPRLTGTSLAGSCLLVALVLGVLILLVTAVPMAALLASVAAAFIPVLLIRRRVRVRQRLLRSAWPDAVDALLSAVRAGVSLPEAVCALGEKGPAPLRPAFADFATDYRATGAFIDSLESLGHQLADPVADRVFAALRIAREVGGNDLGTVLRTLSALLREDARLRGEIEARQSWTVNAARLAVAAPWITLALLSTRPEAVRAYSSGTGALVLLTAVALSLAAYRAMMWIGRLPTEPRLVRP